MGEVEELTGAELRFSPEETGQLLRLETGEPVDQALEASVQASVGGWPAAIRLIALSGASEACSGESRSLNATRSSWATTSARRCLTGCPAPTATSSCGHRCWTASTRRSSKRWQTEQGGEPLRRDEVERLRALELFREIPGLSETWFAYHPLFREVLRRELERTMDAAAIAARWRSIARWFATAGLTLEAVQHLVALDDIPAATALIESRLSDAFAREDWQSVASWLRSIPMEAVRESPELLLASAWVAYLSGRDALLADILETMRGARNLAPRDSGTARRDRPPHDHPGSRSDRSDRGRGTRDRRHPAPQPISLRYAHMTLGMALNAAGRGKEALSRLAAFTERESARIDAASIRGYFARALVLRQSGRLARCEQTAADQLQLAAMNGLPVSAGWGRSSSALSPTNEETLPPRAVTSAQ